ncbi:hypothetical protein BJV78DRAFT_1249615 [Lactifluus subvellereus]|nr:hypothetical protein BJV78DRAFT_1249615 [Lactifluus subvellereus]
MRHEVHSFLLGAWLWSLMLLAIPPRATCSPRQQWPDSDNFHARWRAGSRSQGLVEVLNQGYSTYGSAFYVLLVP